MDIDEKSMMSSVVFTKVCLKSTKFYPIWSVYGQLIQTSTKFYSCKLNSSKTLLKKNYENKKYKNLSRALFQWSGGDANQFFYFTWPNMTMTMTKTMTVTVTVTMTLITMMTMTMTIMIMITII